jgi:hypothetical protein
VDYIYSDVLVTNKTGSSSDDKLTFRDCQKVYIGQTGRSLKISYEEHIRSIKYILQLILSCHISYMTSIRVKYSVSNCTSSTTHSKIVIIKY